MKSALHLGAAALALSFAGAAVAAEPMAPPTAGSPFATLDTNKDGRLSQAEVRANADLNSRFTILDSDSDTYLSQLEYGKWEGTKQAPLPGNGGRMPPNDPAGTGSPSDPSSTTGGIGSNGGAERAPQ